MKKLFLLFAASLVAFSCSDSVAEDTTDPTKPQDDSTLEDVEGFVVEVTTPLTEESKSRISVEPSTTTTEWEVLWSKNDMLGGWSTGQSEFAKFDIVGDGGDATSSFAGEVAGSDLRLVYPYSATNSVVDNLYTIDLSSQRSSMSDKGLSLLTDFTYMVSAETIADATTEQNYSAAMEHIGAVMQITLRFADLPADATSTIKRIDFGVEGEQDQDITIPTKATVDLTKTLTDGAYTATENGSMVISVENCEPLTAYADDEAEYSVAFNTLPFTLESGKSISFNVVLAHQFSTETIEQEILLTYTNDESGAVEFARGAHHHINKICTIGNIDTPDIPTVDPNEMVEGGDFENGYTTYVMDSRNNCNVEDGVGVDGSRALAIEALSSYANAWDAQLVVNVGSEVTFEADGKYTVSIDLRSTNDIVVAAPSLKSGVNATTLATVKCGSFATTAEWQTFTFELSAAQLDKSDVLAQGNKLSFNFGTGNGTLYIDNVSIIKQTGTSGGDQGGDDSGDTTLTNIINGGDFENGYTSYVLDSRNNCNVEDGVGVDGSRALAIEALSSYTQSWQAQLLINIGSGVTFEADGIYTVTLDLRSTNDIVIAAPTLKSAASSDVLATAKCGSLATTAEWQTFTFEISAAQIDKSEGLSQANRISFNFGTGNGILYIDNVSVVKK